MRTIERTDSAAFSWPIGSVQYIEGEPWMVHKKVRGDGARVELVEHDEYMLESCMVTPLVSFKMGQTEVKAEVGTSCADFLGMIRRALLKEISGKTASRGR